MGILKWFCAFFGVFFGSIGLIFLFSKYFLIAFAFILGSLGFTTAFFGLKKLQ
jgi:hypothetical protein